MSKKDIALMLLAVFGITSPGQSQPHLQGAVCTSPIRASYRRHLKVHVPASASVRLTASCQHTQISAP
ncbi:MAG: hypothetical protein P4N41_00825, partial [Negativicutes bacterium]|nr:hypothetical protein [Negativicutes bacterium]